MSKKYKITSGKLRGEIIELEEVEETTEQVVGDKTLEWGESSVKMMTWHKAVEWAKSKGDGWRLPTSIELHQAFLDGVKGLQANFYWSGTEVPSDPTSAYRVNLGNGDMLNDAKTNADYVRCVR